MPLQTKTNSVLKIAHYNIFQGGTKRLGKIAKVIKEINPDICGLLECVGWENDEKKFKQFFKSKGYPFFYFVKANSKYNISVISKIELEVTPIRNGIQHVMVGAKIKDNKYPSINIFYLHLSPKSEDDRIKEISLLLKQLSRLDTVLIMGDLNSLSPRDNYKEKELIEKFKKYGITKYGVDYLKFDLIKKIEANNFIDVFKHLKNKFTFSAPTKYNTDINHSEKIRIDYAFAKKEILRKIKECKIYKSKMTESASDHYPLYVQMKRK